MGFWFSRRQSDTQEYFIGGRSLPWWAVGLSLFGTSISTATFIAIPGQGFGGDWKPHGVHLMLPFAMIFISFFVIPFYRKTIRMSAYEFLETRFGYGARCYVSVFFIITHLFKTGLVLFLMAMAVNAMTGWSASSIVIITGIIAILYTMLGGLEAVIWTDVMQSVTLFGGGVICLVILLFGGDQDPSQLFQVANDAHKFTMVDWSLNLKEATIWVTGLYGLTQYMNNYTTGQQNVQRYLAVSSDRQAKKAVWLSAIHCVITWTLFILIGTLLYAYYQIHTDALPSDIRAQQTQVFPYFVMSRLPAGVTGLVLAGMCAAAMSTLDSSINSMAMVSIRDFYIHFRPQSDDRRQLLLGKILSCFWGVIGVVLALIFLLGVEEALKFYFTVFSIIGGGLLGLFLLGFFVPRAHATGVYIGLACGVLLSAWGILDIVLTKLNSSLGLNISEDIIQSIKFPLHIWLIWPLANFVSFTVGYLASLIIPDRKRKNDSRVSGTVLP
ncbi:MAG: sodium/solute symporter [Sedimentisphaerales bacterium]|nr:sodium/solute symporter [Sedimentisphaerales bacterium]